MFTPSRVATDDQRPDSGRFKADVHSCQAEQDEPDRFRASATMNRRTFEGPMDWEYQDQGPVDVSSPFAQLSRKQHICK